ncbi:hypothetical protein A4X13_0g8634, partial [Tilletia indica]
LYQVAREKGMTPANIKKGYAATGIWPFTGLAAIPASMLNVPLESQDEVEERGREAHLSSELGEALDDLSGRQRSAKAKATLIAAARSAREASALNVLFEDLTERLRQHAAAMKAKPRAFRVIPDDFGKAKLYTSDEAIRVMEETIKARQAEEARKEQAAEEREQRREEKEREKEEAAKRRALEKKEREANKARALQQKEEQKKELAAARLKRKLELAEEKEAEKRRKIAEKQSKKTARSTSASSTNQQNTPALQPSQLVNQ